MSRRSPSWLSLVLVAALLLQALTPVLPAPTLAHAAEAAPANASVLGQPRLLNLRAWLITFGAHILTSAATSSLMATFDSPLPTPTPNPLGTRLPVFDSPLPLPTPDPESHLTLRLWADPAWVEPGQSVTFTLTAENTGNASLPELTLTNMLPEGLLYVAQSAVGFSYDPPARRLTWAAGELAAGAVSTGSFQARVQGRAIGETITNTVRAASPALAAPVTVNADVETVPPRNNETWVTPGEGGLLRSADDRVLLRIPPGAVQERTRFTYQPQAAVPPNPPAGLRFAFRVTAQGEDGQAAPPLAAPLEVTWAARPHEDVRAGERLTLYAYDETAQQWTRLPARTARGAAQQAQATAAQVTLFAVTAESSFVPEVMPSIRGVQNDLFSGSASIAYPIALPAGRGELTPELALQFNSLSRQGDAGNASVLGTGWKLSADSFVYGTPFIAGSGPNTWRIAGAAYTEAGNDSTGWYLREAPQWRIAKPAGGNGALDAYAPDGTRYHFEPALHDWWNSGANARTDKWALQYVRDPLGNQIDYVYDSALPVDPVDVRNHWSNYADALGPRYRYFDDGDFGVHYLAQINLKQIRYNGGQTVVEFAHTARDDAPEPFCQPGNPAVDSAVWGQFTTRLLTGIRVRQGGQLVAGYKLSYDHWGSAATCAYWARYALQTIARCSDEGLTNCLPATGFTNAPQENKKNGVLTQYANSYGGQVAFGYGADGVVAARTVTDLVTSTANQWSYSYTDKLYDGWNVVGYAQATETLPSSLGAGNTINHHFINGNGVDAGFRGKEDQQSVTVGGVKQQEVTRVWTGTTAGVYGGGKLVYLSEERQLIYDKDGQNPQTRKTTYFYDLNHQGNAQYGNLTRQKAYSDDGVTLYRTTERWFYPRVDLANGKYIVNRVAQEKLWDGGNICQSQTRQIYDTTGFNQQQTPPTQGLLKEVWQARVCDSASQGDWVRPALHSYDSYGNLASTTAANGAVTSTSYDTTFGTYPTSVTTTPGTGGGATLTTSYTYYGINQETGGSGLKGQLQKATDPNGAATRTTYDAFGRALELRQPGAAFTNPATEQLAYTDATPYSVKHSLRDDANGDTSSTATYLDDWTFYDGLGQVLQTQAEGATNSQSVVVSQQANALGAVIGATPPYIGTTPGVYQPFNWTTPPQPVTRSVYDSLGRVMQVTQPDGSVVKTFYHGRKAATLDALGHQAIREVDAFGRLSRSQQFAGSYAPSPNWNATVYAQAQYQYNVRDQLEQVIGPDSAITDPTYNLLGQKTQMVDPDLGTWNYTYDAAGNLVTQTDARGVTLWFGYDGLGRLTEQRQGDAGGPLLARAVYDEAQAGYSNLGRRTRAEGYTDQEYGSAVNTLAQRYDARGRVAAVTRTLDNVAYTTGYAYDSADRVTTLTYPDGEQVTTTYDAQGRTSSLTSNQLGVLADNTSYDAAARLTSVRYPVGGGLVRRQVYYPWNQQGGRVQQLLVGTSATSAERLNLAYTYDVVGNVTSSSDNGSVSTFNYDALDRLVAAYGQSFAYDAAGRLTSFAGLAYTPDSGHPHAVNLVNGVDRYDYDLNGNQVVRNKGVPNQEQYLTWDAANRLRGVTYTNRTPAGGGSNPPPALCNGVPCKRMYLPLVTSLRPAEQYSYDADGGRVRKASASEVTRYVAPHYEVTLAVASGQVLTTTKYYDFGGQRLAVRQNNTLSYLHGDHLGSTSVTTSNTGTKTNDVRYFAFGDQRSGNLLALPTDHTFTGQKLDRSTVLLYYGARYYDSALGMFISPDTLVPSPGDPQSLNRYAYVKNNPIRYIDSTGHCGPLTPVCLGLLLGGMALLLQGDSPDLNVTPEDVASQRLGGALVVGGAVLAGGSALAGTVGATQAGTAVTAACADGDCTNEVQGAGQAAQNAARAAESGTKGAKFGFDAKVGQYRELATGRFVSPKDLPWPSSRGFAGNPVETALSKGSVIDRYGSLSGQYAGTPGATISERGMAAGAEGMRYTRLEVVKPITVPGGFAAAVSEFGASGGALQYFFEGGLQKWIDQGYLRILP